MNQFDDRQPGGRREFNPRGDRATHQRSNEVNDDEKYGGLCITLEEGEPFHIEDLDERGDVRRITIELRRSNHGTAQVAIDAPDDTVIRRDHIAFAGQCEGCGRLLRPSKHHELTGVKTCRSCRGAA